MENYFEEYPSINYPFCLTGHLSIHASALLYMSIDVAAKIRPPTAKICFLSPSVWHALCQFWKKNSALSGTECLVIHLSYFLIYLWVILSICLPGLWAHKKASEMESSSQKQRWELIENIVFVMKLFLKYQLAVGVCDQLGEAEGIATITV